MIESSVGIALAFVTMLCWGFGDFLIQKSTRKVGDWESLFILSFIGVIILFPFIVDDFDKLFSSQNIFWILIATGVLYLFASLLDFESLKIGKISIVEPIWSLEIIVSATLAFFILGEILVGQQIILIALLMLGLVVVSLKNFHFGHLHKAFFEKGSLVALGAALSMGVVNFFVGWGARETDPMMVNFVIDMILVIGCGVYLFSKKRLGQTVSDFKKYPQLLLSMAISDKAAWVAFAFAMSMAPIGISVAIAESYIIIAILLGLLVGKEKIKSHQKFGLALSLISALILAGTIS